MEFSTQELGIIGGAITGLTVTARGLIKLLESRMASTKVSAEKLTGALERIEKLIVGHISTESENTDKIFLELRALDGIDAEIQEILRILRDPTSSVSTEETNRMLGKILISLVGIREALRPRDRD